MTHKQTDRLNALTEYVPRLNIQINVSRKFVFKHNALLASYYITVLLVLPKLATQHKNRFRYHLFSTVLVLNMNTQCVVMLCSSVQGMQVVRSQADD